MKIEKISEHIWSLNMRLLIPFNAWAVVDEDGVTLVDAGLPMMAGGIMQFIDSLQAGPLRRIVLTHGHSDHVGSIARIVSAAPVPVYAHAVEIPYMEGELPYPRRKKAAPSVAKGLALPLPENEHGNLQPIGGLTPYLTPGHSPGHVVYYHEKDEVLLAGDLFTSKRGELRRPMPMFTGDMAEAVRSASIVGRLQPARLEVGHGDSVFRPAEQLEAYMNRNLQP
jgi:glyoxylase-like metal-dependent hydrolase (beta-lactamase superfamily II)